MSAADTSSGRAVGGAQQFTATHWSVVLAAGQGSSSQAQTALSQLCQTYWYPLYAFVRRNGYDAQEAQDLTQEFFARMLEKNYLADVQPQKGKFRSFLLASLKHFLANEWDRRQTIKRGGGLNHISWDSLTAEERYRLEPSHDDTAERIFERRWALTLLEQTLARLRHDLELAGKAALFDKLKGFLTGERAGPSYAELGQELKVSEGAVKVIVHRLRQRYRDLLRQEIAHTVGRAEDGEAELAELLAALRGS